MFANFVVFVDWLWQRVKTFFGNLFGNKYIFKGIKELIAVDIKKYNFPNNKYKLYAADTKIIKDFFTELI